MGLRNFEVNSTSWRVLAPADALVDGTCYLVEAHNGGLMLAEIDGMNAAVPDSGALGITIWPGTEVRPPVVRYVTPDSASKTLFIRACEGRGIAAITEA